MFDYILKWLAVLAAVTVGFVGNMPNVIRVLLIVMFFDILTGVAQAVIQKTLDSHIAFNGIAKKAVCLMIVALTYTLTSQIAGVDAGAPVGQTVAGFYIAVEVISILEKADSIGVPIPDFLRTALNNLKSTDRRQSPPIFPAYSAPKDLPPQG